MSTILVLVLAAPALAVAPVSGATFAQSKPGLASNTSSDLETALSLTSDTELDPGELPEFSAPGLPANRARSSRAASQCQYGQWASMKTDAADAARMMSGWARIEHYGTFRLKKNPSWRYTDALDYSGNGHMHSLHWALPLLRHGFKTGNRAMVNRFYKLMLDWIKDNPPSKPRQWKAYGQIESGFRLLTMSCALAGPGPSKKKKKKLANIEKAIRTQARVASTQWVNVNNVSFLQGAGIFAAGCSLGDRKILKRGKKFMSKNSKKMIAPDGSVREGSLQYARNTYVWTQQEIARIRACGKAPGNKLRRSDRIADFLAHSARPDRRYEALGDGGTPRVSVEKSPANSALRFVATGGTEGPPPASLYRTYEAGYIFGHSGFGKSRKLTKETYYSVRTGPGPEAEYHAHYDAAAVTLASRGDQLLFDTGQYRYIKNSAATFVRSRPAHNNITIDGHGYGGPRPAVVAASSSPRGDFTSIVDSAFGGKRLQRSIWYDREGDYLVVMDDVDAAVGTNYFANWNVGRDRTVTIDDQTASTSGSGANVSLINVGTAVSLSSAAGKKSPWQGWNSAKYGELVASPSIRAVPKTPGPTPTPDPIQTADPGGDPESPNSGQSPPVPLMPGRMVTVIIPRSAGVGPGEVSATGELTPAGARVTTTIEGVRYPIEITATGVSRVSE